MSKKCMFSKVSEFVFSEKKKKRERMKIVFCNIVFRILVIFYILYFKTEKNNMHSIHTIKNDNNMNMCSVG